MPNRVRLATLTALSLALPSSVFAGALFVMQDSTEPEQPTRIQVEDDSMSVQSDSRMAMVYRGKADTMFILDHEEQRFTRIDRETVKQLMADVAPALREMQEQLAAMPPEQRAMVEKMMKGRMPNMAATGEPPKREARATGKSGEQAGVDCEWHDVTLDGVLVERTCVADTDDIPGADEAFASMRSMAEFMTEVFAPLREQMPFAMPESPVEMMEQLDGIPVITQQIEGGQIASTTALVDAQEVDIPDSAFQIPSNYKEQRMDMR